MRLRVAVLSICMLITGSLNTIATKIQDNVVVGHDAAGQPLRFKHPLFQTAAMFLGETLCLIPFALRRWYKHATRAAPMCTEEATERRHRLRRSFVVFSLPAMCDAAASSLLNAGLFYTYASVFQMLRGTLVIFAGLLTILLLHRRLHSHHWLGIVLIGAGAALVGASSVIYDRADPRHDYLPQPPDGRGAAAMAVTLGGSSGSSAAAGEPGDLRRLLMLEGLAASSGVSGGGSGTAPNPLLGNILVVLAQLLAATQFIVEEKYLVRYHAPVLLAVGMEGFWGVALCCLAVPALQHIPGPGGRPLDSFSHAWAEVCSDFTLQWTTATTVISIAFFNFFGVSVTKNLSGAARATIDACRTLFIWLFALHVGWEHFHMLQVVGFLVLLSGTSVYNEILRTCLPAPEPRHHHHRSHAGHADAEAGLVSPLLLEGHDFQNEAAAVAAQQKALAAGTTAEGGASVRFAEVPASQPIAARRGGASGSRGRYTMARSVTILPAALSPHSLASVPSVTFGGTSFTFSVPRNLSRGGRLGGAATDGEDEEEGATPYTESEVSESDYERERGDDSSRDVSQHGPSPCLTPPGDHRSSGTGDGTAGGERSQPPEGH